MILDLLNTEQDHVLGYLFKMSEYCYKITHSPEEEDAKKYL